PTSAWNRRRAMAASSTTTSCSCPTAPPRATGRRRTRPRSRTCAATSDWSRAPTKSCAAGSRRLWQPGRPPSQGSNRRRMSTLVRAAPAAVLSVASAIYFHVQGLTLLYPDAQARLLIARRVIDNPTPGLAQLGGVWLPLPQVVMLPLIWIDPLYYSGWA